MSAVDNVRRFLVLLGLLGALAGAGSAAPTASAHTVCGAGFVAASLPWGHKCLRAGEFCKVGNAAYARFGFSCPSSGHLRRR
jgi:hypothetical protein